MRYRCTYADEHGDRAVAVQEAENEQALYEALQREGRILLQARSLAPRETRPRKLSARLSSADLMALTQALETSLDAGVPLLAVLEAMRDQETEPRVRQLYATIIEDIQRGSSLADALAAHPRAFPDVYTALVRAGESSGSLPMVFARLGGFLQWREKLRSTAKHAMVYPCVVGTAAYGLVMFLLWFVIPRLGEILRKVSDDLPAASRILLDVSDIVAGNILLVLAGTAALVFAAYWALQSDLGKSVASSVAVRLPIAKGVVRALNLAKLCHTISLLLRAGLTMTTSLQLTRSTLTLPDLRDRIGRIEADLEGGQRVCDAFQRAEVLPPLGLSMLRVSEEAGGLPKCFERLGESLDRQAQSAVERLVAMLEPAITVLLGVIVGTIAAVIISTLYKAVGGLAR